MSVWTELGSAIRRVARQEGARGAVKIDRYRVVELSPLTLVEDGGGEVLEQGDENFELACDVEALSVGDVVMVLDSDGIDVALGPVDEDAPPPNAKMPTAAEKAALAGTDGAPGAGNRYVTNSDPRNTNARAPSAHVHPQADVTGLTAALAAKQDAATAATDAELAAHAATAPAHGGDLAGTARPPTAHVHPQADVTGLAAALAAKQDASTAATDAELAAHTGLTTSAHGGIVASTDPRLTDARAPTAHSHVQADVTGLAAALAAKQDAATAATDAELSAHAALKTGVHGIPALGAGQGLMWDGTNWTAVTVALASDIAALDARLGAIEAHPESQGVVTFTWPASPNVLSNSMVVAHGLAGTPQVAVASNDPNLNVSCSAVDGTNMTFRARDVAGVTHGPGSFGACRWRARL